MGFFTVRNYVLVKDRNFFELKKFKNSFLKTVKLPESSSLEFNKIQSWDRLSVTTHFEPKLQLYSLDFHCSLLLVFHFWKKFIFLKVFMFSIALQATIQFFSESSNANSTKFGYSNSCHNLRSKFLFLVFRCILFIVKFRCLTWLVWPDNVLSPKLSNTFRYTADAS